MRILARVLLLTLPLAMASCGLPSRLASVTELLNTPPPIDGFEEVGTGRVLRGTLKRIQRKLPSDGFGDG